MAHVKPPLESPAVVQAKAMHKGLKWSKEMTAFLFIGAADNEAVVGTFKWLVSQFKDSVLTI